MWRILQHTEPDDFVLATGVTTRIRDFVIMVFKKLGVHLQFEGQGVNEIGKVVNCEGKYKLAIGQTVVKVDPRYFRPTEVDLLIGDATKAFNKLGWKPTFTLEELVNDMVESDIKAFTKNQILRSHGFEYVNEFE
jgi:GDPmannose 4,6-dehydratase